MSAPIAGRDDGPETVFRGAGLGDGRIVAAKAVVETRRTVLVRMAVEEGALVASGIADHDFRPSVVIRTWTTLQSF